MKKIFTSTWEVQCRRLTCRFCHQTIDGIIKMCEHIPTVPDPNKPSSYAHPMCVQAFQQGLRAAFRGEPT